MTGACLLLESMCRPLRHCQVLRSVYTLPPNLEAIFKGNVFRISETDEDSACLRVERCVPLERDAAWTNAGLNIICAAHKLHTSAERTWQMFPACVTGMIHVYKCLQDGDLLETLRRKTRQEIRLRLHIFKRGGPPPLSDQFKQHMMRLFLPQRCHSRKYAIMMQLCEFLNGDWRDKSGLQHYCCGSCCVNEQETVAKLDGWLVKMLWLQKRDFSKNNWKSWHQGLYLFGLAGGLHNFLGKILQDFFHSQEVGELPLAAQNEADIVGREAMVRDRDAPAVPNEVADDVERARQDKAKSMRIAQNFLDGHWFHDVWLLRAALDGEIRAMSRLLHSCSEAHDVCQMCAWAPDQQRSFRFVDMVKGEVTKPVLMAALQGVRDEGLWSLFPETEAERSIVLRACLKPAALTWQLLDERYRGFPWKTFLLLETKDLQIAAALLGESPCMMDGWTQRLFQKFQTPESLLTEEFHTLLFSMAAVMDTSTTRVESTQLPSQQVSNTVQANARWEFGLERGCFSRTNVVTVG